MATTGQRLNLLYEISRRLTTLPSVDALTRYATEQARDLFAAGGCALLLHDPSRHELFFPVASEDPAHGLFLLGLPDGWTEEQFELIVEDLHLFRGRDQDVARLQVAVDHTVAVGVGDRLR